MSELDAASVDVTGAFRHRRADRDDNDFDDLNDVSDFLVNRCPDRRHG